MLSKEYYSSPRWSGEIADCSMPMTLDTYSNCSFQCLYCFSQFQRGIGKAAENYLSKQVIKSVNINKIKKIFLEPDSSQFWPYIKDRKVIQFGGLSDQFDRYERAYGKTLEILRFLRSIDYPICFSTKSVWWADDRRYAELFEGNKNWNVKVSIVTLDEDKAKKLEVGVPTPKDRLSLIEKINKFNGGGATLRLRPFIIGISNPTHVELIMEAGLRGASALSTEFFCLEMRSKIIKDNINIFNSLCGFDVMEFYKKYSIGTGYLRLNRNVKRSFVYQMSEACKESGMRFYISDAHFKELSENGSCCGLPESWNYSRGQFCNALIIAKQKGTVTYSEIKEDIDKYLKQFYYTKAEGFNTGCANQRAKYFGMTMAEYMRYLWNTPSHGQSPYRLFEGILIPEGKDPDNNYIYKYNKEKE